MVPSDGRGEQRNGGGGRAQCILPEYPVGLQSVVRVGVTGHRDLADRERAEAVTADALCRLLTVLEPANRPSRIMRSPGRGPGCVGYRVISPLAEGADRVVAALVLSPDARLYHRTRELIAPLPFGLDYYRGRDGEPGSDCRNPKSQAEFDRLWRAAVRHWSLHDAAPVSPPQRDGWYRDVGSYVVEHCDFLFALWDGSDNRREGGTAAVVQLALANGTPVIWIPVTRKETTEPTAALPDDGEARLLTRPGLADAAAAPRLSSPEAEAAILGRGQAPLPTVELVLERFRRLADLRRYFRRGRPVQASVGVEIADATAAPSGNAGAVRSVADWIIPEFVIADGLAQYYQRLLKALNIGVYAAASAAVTLGAFAAILFPYRGIWLLPVVFEAIVLVALFVVLALDLRRKCRDQWVTFRALAEYFRIGRFLALVTPASARGLEFDRFAWLHSWSPGPVSVPWFAPVLERVWERRPGLDLRDSDVPWLRSYLAGQWVDDQIGYYRSRAKIHERWDEIFRWAIRVTLLATILIVVTHVILDYLPPDAGAHRVGRDTVSLSLAFLAIALTSVAGALNGYSGQQRHNYHAARFCETASELAKIRMSVCDATTMEQLRTHLRTARRTMLGETTDWYADMEQQEIDSPS
jgi:hypothetical protein